MSHTPEKLAEIRRLHAAYVRLTGLAVSLDLQGYREMVWFQWMRLGFTEADLVCVVRYVKGFIQRGDRGWNLGTLKFNSLIGQPDKFEELLAEARVRGKSENRKPKSEILRVSGRDSQSAIANSRTKSVGEVAARIAGDPERAREAFEAFRKLKGTL